jgi:hypothetical protein
LRVIWRDFEFNRTCYPNERLTWKISRLVVVIKTIAFVNVSQSVSFFFRKNHSALLLTFKTFAGFSLFTFLRLQICSSMNLQSNLCSNLFFTILVCLFIGLIIFRFESFKFQCYLTIRTWNDSNLIFSLICI